MSTACPHCSKDMGAYSHGCCQHCRKMCGCSFNPTSLSDFCRAHHPDAPTDTKRLNWLLANPHMLSQVAGRGRNERAEIDAAMSSIIKQERR